ncbi:phospholipid carrier-dependent glycosyltransferase [Agromyces mediolanus]|uniref:phospholipid carrier-dependent glycosyltransferase n=1 Tax=Agromyces mediolanus TaxID=41986 RepID=UPI00203FEF49|nr:phospholipid carrier-dependent glycosyltransferase [Agromyces mediolanus]MCM3656390.1 phospholipid carrier-dependent glycosyltransferase [Agromyces mediolanus]
MSVAEPPEPPARGDDGRSTPPFPGSDLFTADPFPPERPHDPTPEPFSAPEPTSTPEPTSDPEPTSTPEPTGSRHDEWWARLLATPRRHALWYWGGPLLVTLLAAVLRFWNLGHPQALVFDETYYVKDAWTLLQHGYESTWPDGADADFAAGDTDVYGDAASYVVHPPLGKWMIALGMAAFGADSAFWWRASTALAGTVAVFLLTLAGRRLFGSTMLAVIAGLLFAVDGNAIVMSRVALLDNWLMLFALLGFWFVLLDRDWTARRLEQRVGAARAAGRDPHYGPVVWARPWVIAAGAAFGAAAAVKWSGAWFVAAFGIYLVIVDAVARRRAGLPLWASGAVLKQAPATFLLLVPIAVGVYLASWTGWFVTSGGYDRHWAETAGNAATGWLSWVPLPLQSLWHFHQSAYTYHVGVHTPHPWQANPLTWLFMIRPTNMYYADSAGCGDGGCTESIIGLGNPLIWWAAAISAGYLVYRLIRRREWAVGAILVGLAAGYLPWLAYLDRTVFQFYSIAFEPFLLLGLTFVIGLILGHRGDPSWRRERGILTVAVFLIAVVLVSAFFLPIWTAQPIPPLLRQLHFWLPSWG